MKFKVSYDGILPKSVMLDEVGYVRDDVADQLRAEITQLRADLAAERELADRLAEALDEMDRWHGMTDKSAPALTAHATRRNK